VTGVQTCALPILELVSRWAREVVEEPWRRLTLQARGVLPLLALEGTFDRISLCVRTLCVRSLRVRAALCFWARCLWPRRAWALCFRALCFWARCLWSRRA